MYDEITKYFKSLLGYENRFEIQEQLKEDIIEKLFYNSLRGKKRFDAHVLKGWEYNTSTPGGLDNTGRYIAVHLRPKDIHDFLLPAPCPNDPDLANFIVSMHPIGISQSPIATTGLTFNVGDVVSCYWDYLSPQFHGAMKGLKFELGKVSTAQGNFDFSCLKGKPIGFATGQMLNAAIVGAKKKGKHKSIIPAGTGQAIASPYHIDDVGLTELIDSEGSRDVVYDDKNGRSISSYSQAIDPTIGVGHLIKSNEKSKYEKYLKGRQRMPESEIKALLDKDIVRKEDRLNKKITQPITQSMWNALVSLAFNAGTGASSVRRCIAAINRKNYSAAQMAIANGPVTSRGKRMEGLVKRRAKEAEWFMAEGLPK
tara:strand:- start:1337 stop:2443 length:1107 start_codon:yes stop_codon:yes gene_type:complete